MKSKKDIYIAMAGLAELSKDNEMDEIERTVAVSGLSILCWVMDLPTEFDETFDAMKEKYGKHSDKITELIDGLGDEFSGG